MEVYRTADNLVGKYVHDDGSETAIKSVNSCSHVLNKMTGKIEEVYVDRRKYTVFASISVGCGVGCKFCYLTVKKCPYLTLTTEGIVVNLQEALKAEIKANPHLKDRYIKLSWMGMGDAFGHSRTVTEATIIFLEWVLKKKYAKGVDGVDLGTVIPQWINNYRSISFDFRKDFINLNEALDKYPKNDYNTERSRLRIFYSLHSVSDTQVTPEHWIAQNIWDNRTFIIPRALKLDYAVRILKHLRDNGIDVIFHQMFLDGVNDEEKEVQDLIEFVRNFGAELRVLRFNKCPNTHYRESRHFDKIVKQLSDGLNKVKYQISPGSEVQAACGQFIIKDYRHA
jgi:hypothetical protein